MTRQSAGSGLAEGSSMGYAEHLDVPYAGATSPRQSLDLFLPDAASSSSPLLAFIHGGAWRSEAKSDFTHTLMPSLVRNAGLPCACLEYRLAPADPHPAQILDVVSGLELLTGPLLPLEAGDAKWDRTHLIVAGHSAGAFMAATLVLRPPPTHPASSARSSPFSVPDSVRQAVRGIICIDGIYDLPALLDEYPSYASFVSEAFGTDPPVLAAESPARWDRYNDDAGRNVRILVLHSKGDELLSLRQPRVFLRRAKQLFYAGGEAGVKDKADEATSEADERDLPANVEVDFESLRGGHYEVVKGDELAQLIALRSR